MTSDAGVRDAVFARPAGQAARARHRGPVWWDERFDGWAVGSYAAVDTVLREHAVYSSDELAVGPQAPHAETPILRSLVAIDPPRHHRLRSVVSRIFTPRALDRVDAAIERTADELLRDAAPNPEVVAGLVSPLTTSMLAHLLGIRSDRRRDVVRWTHVVAAFIGPEALDPHRRAEFFGVVAEMEDAVRESAATPGAAPDSALAALSVAHDAGDLDERELVDFLILLIVAGHETTTRLIYHAVLCLERFPAELDAVRAGDVTVEEVVEEVARFLPPTGGVDRFTATATVLAGQPLDPGQRIVALLAAANRDPAVFDRPDRFVPGRIPRRHLGFGRGVHACLGAHLARREARIALGRLLAHAPGRWHVPEDTIDADTTPVGIDIHRMTLVSG